LASTALRTDFRTEGLTLEKMGLTGATAETLAAILENGFSNSWRAAYHRDRVRET
jgi:hypothetical protein